MNRPPGVSAPDRRLAPSCTTGCRRHSGRAHCGLAGPRAPKLREDDAVQDQVERHQHRRDQRPGQLGDGRRAGTGGYDLEGEAVGRDRPEGDREDQVGGAQVVPGSDAGMGGRAAGKRGGERQREETDGDVAPAGRLGLVSPARLRSQSSSLMQPRNLLARL